MRDMRFRISEARVISPRAPLYLADISPRSPLWNPLLTSLQVMHLPYISRASPPYLPCR